MAVGATLAWRAAMAACAVWCDVSVIWAYVGFACGGRGMLVWFETRQRSLQKLWLQSEYGGTCIITELMPIKGVNHGEDVVYFCNCCSYGLIVPTTSDQIVPRTLRDSTYNLYNSCSCCCRGCHLRGSYGEGMMVHTPFSTQCTWKSSFSEYARRRYAWRVTTVHFRAR
jgi:hypothetical protein